MAEKASGSSHVQHVVVLEDIRDASEVEDKIDKTRVPLRTNVGMNLSFLVVPARLTATITMVVDECEETRKNKMPERNQENSLVTS